MRATSTVMKHKILTTGMEILIIGISIGLFIGFFIGAALQHYKTYGN